MSRPKKWPDVPDVPNLTVEKLLGHWLYSDATDEEIAYSAQCTVEEVQATRRAIARKGRAA